MSEEIKRAVGLLIIEVVNSNPNGDPDRESDIVSGVVCARVKKQFTQ